MAECGQQLNVNVDGNVYLRIEKLGLIKIYIIFLAGFSEKPAINILGILFILNIIVPRQ